MGKEKQCTLRKRGPTGCTDMALSVVKEKAAKDSPQKDKKVKVKKGSSPTPHLNKLCLEAASLP